jgi:hypothetical protein
MVWIIQPMERKDPETKQGLGKWDLIAKSDEDGGFWPCLPTPDHPGFDTPEEAAANPEARAIAANTAGLTPKPSIAPYQQRVVDEKRELDQRIIKLVAFLQSPPEGVSIGAGDLLHD